MPGGEVDGKCSPRHVPDELVELGDRYPVYLCRGNPVGPAQPHAAQLASVSHAQYRRPVPESFAAASVTVKNAGGSHPASPGRPDDGDGACRSVP